MQLYVHIQYRSAPFEDHPWGPVSGGLSKEVVSDEGEVSIGHIYTCDQQSLSDKRGGLSQGWSLKGGTTVHTYVQTLIERVSTCLVQYIRILRHALSLPLGDAWISIVSEPDPPHSVTYI